MPKPASGTTLDTGHALYTNLSMAWGLLEGSGTTTTDSKSARTGTLSSSGLWSTDGDGPIILTTNSSDNTPIGFSSDFTFSGTSITLAWRAKQTTSNDNGMLLGSPNTSNNYVWLRGGTNLTLKINASVVGTMSPTDYTALDDWVLACELEPAVTYHHHLFKNGVEVSGSPLDNGGVGLAMTINAIGNGFTSGISFVGTISYVYAWDGRMLTGAEAATLHSNPYAIFTGGAAPTTTGPFRSRRLRPALFKPGAARIN